MDTDEVLKKFGFIVKVERMRQNLSQAELAELVGVHEKYISKIESGKQNVTIQTLNRIAQALELDVYKLLQF